MHLLQLVLILVIASSAIQICIWLRRAMYTAAIFGSAFVVIYLVDVLNISLSETTYIAASVGVRSASIEAISTAIVLVTITWIFFSLGVEFVSPRRPEGLVEDTRFIDRRFRFVAFALLSALFGGAVLSKILSVGIVQTLELRQAVFSDSFLVLLGYFVLPVLVSLGIAHAIQVRGITAVSMWSILFGLLTITALTGSRSGLFLGAIIPVMALAWKRIATSARSVKRDLQRIVLVAALVAVPVLGGGVYLASTRGVVESGSFLDSTDVSQADVLVDLISSDVGGFSSGSTYLASITSAVPRSLWPEKPFPGNVATSIVLTPERYYLTGAETTSGLLGEAYINVGPFAPLVGAMLMILFLIFCSKFLKSRDDIIWMVGVILLIRGLNLLRGDLTNVVVPALTAIFVWSLLYRATSRSKIALTVRS